LDFYFDVFLQSVKTVKTNEYLKEIDRYNACINESKDHGEIVFFSEINKKYPEFETLFKKHLEEKNRNGIDLIQYILEHSDFLNKSDNKWMKSVIEVVRKTSLFFQPQIRTKIMNEGWASYWHEILFLQDDRINGHEVDFAKVNAGVTALPRVGLNPYALGLRLFYDIEDRANKGKYSFRFERLFDSEIRKTFDENTGQGKDVIFRIRQDFCDFMFIHTFVDQDFVTQNKLFVAGRRLNRGKNVWEYYVKSRKAQDYREMLLAALYHPPHIEIDTEPNNGNTLYLVHHFEGKSLVRDFIANTLLGIEYLWGGTVKLETSEIEPTGPSNGIPSGWASSDPKDEEEKVKWRRVVYTMENRKLSRKTL
jgi:stage V sporulation protein R